MVLRGSNPYSYRPKKVPAKLLENGSEPNTGSVGTTRIVHYNPDLSPQGWVPRGPPRWCRVCHIAGSLYMDQEMRYKFWEACKTGTPKEFKGVMDEIYALDNGAHEYLMKQNPNTWAKAYFTRHCTCDVVENNMCETSNGFILEARVKAIIYMLEEIRKSLMVRMQKKREQMEKWEGTQCPRAVEKLEANEMQHRYWRTIFNGSKEFEESERYMSSWCNIELTRKAYDYYLKPVNGERMWEKTHFHKFLPPLARRMLGRPKKNRTRELHEDLKKNPSEISRKGRRMKCKKCAPTTTRKRPYRSNEASGSQCGATPSTAPTRPPKYPGSKEPFSKQPCGSEARPSKTPNKRTLTKRVNPTTGVVSDTKSKTPTKEPVASATRSKATKNLGLTRAWQI
ncbi:hypothetical protein LguiA_025562 [Lonicera macranthoides]